MRFASHKTIKLARGSALNFSPAIQVSVKLRPLSTQKYNTIIPYPPEVAASRLSFRGGCCAVAQSMAPLEEEKAGGEKVRD